MRKKLKKIVKSFIDALLTMICVTFAIDEISWVLAIIVALANALMSLLTDTCGKYLADSPHEDE